MLAHSRSIQNNKVDIAFLYYIIKQWLLMRLSQLLVGLFWTQLVTVSQPHNPNRVHITQTCSAPQVFLNFCSVAEWSRTQSNPTLYLTYV